MTASMALGIYKAGGRTAEAARDAVAAHKARKFTEARFLSQLDEVVMNGHVFLVHSTEVTRSNGGFAVTGIPSEMAVTLQNSELGNLTTIAVLSDHEFEVRRTNLADYIGAVRFGE